MNSAHKPAGPLRRLCLSAARVVALLTIAAVPFTALAQSGEDKSAAAAAKLAEIKAQNEKAATAAPGPEVPKDDRPWLVDEKSGRRYRIENMPKVEGTYRWVNENMARFPGGAVFEVVDHDDKNFRVKAYEIILDDGKASAPKAPAVDPAKIAESYKFDLPEADRVTLVPFDEGLPKRGQWRNGFDLADVNKDGHQDIVFGPARKGRPAPNIFLGDSKGTWKLYTEVRFPAQPYDYGDVAVGDFNGDGLFDLAFGIHLKGMLVLVSDGRGGMEPWTQGIELDIPGKGGDATSFSSRAVDVIDWDLDGKLDVIAMGEGPKGLKTNPNQKDKTKGLINTARDLRIYLNQGNGKWVAQEASRSSSERSNFGDTFALADFDRDGDLDVVVGTRQIGNDRLVGIRKEGGVVEFETLPGLRPQALVLSVIARDLDADGFSDLALGYQAADGNGWRSGVDIFWGGKEGWKRQSLFNREARQGISALDAGDVDGDGKLDLVAIDQASRARILLGDGKRGFVEEKGPGELPPERQGCAAFQVSLIDLNGDKRDEIIIGYAGESGGMPGFSELSVQGCENEGSLRVFSPQPKS